MKVLTFFEIHSATLPRSDGDEPYLKNRHSARAGHRGQSCLVMAWPKVQQREFNSINDV